MHIGCCRYYCSPCFGSRKKKKTNSEDNNNKNTCKPDSSRSASVLEPSTRKKRPDANDTAEVFTYEELASATNNFREEDFIGRGGFGAVYRGRLKRSGQLVAVKQLDKTGYQGEKEFLVEVLMLSLMRHPNLVHLLGFCAEGDQRLLVYEYMPLGSLEDYLYDLPPEIEPLDWNTRMMIAAGAAKGLEYLHNEADPPVIYRDLKCANILLGEGFHPKLSDFGLAKFGPTGDKSHVSTRVMGTHGYCAPEYIATGKLTVKSDIFSLGVVLLELISGRPAMDDSRGNERMLVDWARPRYKDRKHLTQLADPALKGQFSRSSLKKALEVAFLCVHDNPANRPSITDVVYALDYIASRHYDPNDTSKVLKKGQESPDSSPAQSTWMLGGKDLDREQAVAEAKMWGENLRLKQQESLQNQSNGVDSWVNKIQQGDS